MSSRVQAVCDWFGPTDLAKMEKEVMGVKDEVGAAAQPIPKLIGGLIGEKPLEARKASPITYITPDDPPFLIMHGDQDPLVPVIQSISFSEALAIEGVPRNLIIVKGAKHAFFTDSVQLYRVAEFFKIHLKE